jgi:hypothetical protein
MNRLGSFKQIPYSAEQGIFLKAKQGFYSSNTSTGTAAQESAPVIRPAGPVWLVCWSICLRGSIRFVCSAKAGRCFRARGDPFIARKPVAPTLSRHADDFPARKVRRRRTNVDFSGNQLTLRTQGAGIGASHQTGWTGLVGMLIDLFGRLDPVRYLSEGRAAAFAR